MIDRKTLRLSAVASDNLRLSEAKTLIATHLPGDS
jgi:hypothetical protein